MSCLPFACAVFAICQNVLCPFPHFLHLSACLYLFSASFFRSSLSSVGFLSLPLSRFAWLCLCTLLPFCLCRRVICFCLLWQLVEFILSIQTPPHTHTHTYSHTIIHTHTHIYTLSLVASLTSTSGFYWHSPGLDFHWLCRSWLLGLIDRLID